MSVSYSYSLGCKAGMHALCMDFPFQFPILLLCHKIWGTCIILVIGKACTHEADGSTFEAQIYYCGVNNIIYSAVLIWLQNYYYSQYNAVNLHNQE